LAIIKAAARIILKERAHYQFQEPVLCFGVPDVYLTEGDLNGLRSRAAPGTKDFLSASQFLAALGLSQVTSRVTRAPSNYRFTKGYPCQAAN